MADLTAMLQAAANAAATPSSYQISRSLRFNSADSAYLNRTPAGAGDRKTWTWSGWVKRSELGTVQIFTSCHSAGNDSSNMDIGFYGDDTLRVVAWTTTYRTTTQVFRDPSSWYHIIIAVDTTQATANDRVRLYVNGLEITVFTTTNNPSQNADIGYNQAATTRIGSSSNTVGNLCNLYLTEIHFIDGQALTPSDFGETDATTGVWKPKEYTGTYGTNGFYLDFSDNTSTTTLGYDAAGSNDWTTNNFSVTAGTGNDSLVDTPTPYGTDTGVGGQVRGNYCTLNPLDTSVFAGSLALSNGNLQVAGTNESAGVKSTFFISSGKWYWEGTLTSGSTGSLIGIGQSSSIYYPGYSSTSYAYQDNGNKLNNDSGSAYGASYTTNDVIGIALDLDAGTLVFYKNGSTQGTAYSSLSGNFTPHFGAAGGGNSSTWVANFGQRPFAHTAPSGFKALVTTNLPEPTVLQGNDYFNTVLYTGTGSSQSITGVGFQPDWVWIKERSGAADHGLYDAVRGVQQQLESNNLNAETTQSTGLTAFGSDGFTVGSLAQLNTNTDTYVAWNWNAGGSNATNTDGTITSTVRANPTAGFSIVSYTGTGAAATVGHGLGVAPVFMIVKNRDNGYNWSVNGSAGGLIYGTNKLVLQATDALTADNNEVTAVSSSTFSVLDSIATNNSGDDLIAYCFAEVPGFSAFGSYTGNGSADGPFVYTGFRPAFVLYKSTSDGTRNWHMNDAVRSAFNVVDSSLQPNQSSAESTSNGVDYLSNGFKLRSTQTNTNASGGTYLFVAFAENPFKYALAR